MTNTSNQYRGRCRFQVACHNGGFDRLFGGGSYPILCGLATREDFERLSRFDNPAVIETLYEFLASEGHWYGDGHTFSPLVEVEARECLDEGVANEYTRGREQFLRK